MSNSSLATYKKISPNRTSPRNAEIDMVAIHCVVAQWSAKTTVDYLSNSSVEASCNYAVGYDGSIAIGVEEKDRSWCTSSGAIDNRAITIEVASDSFHPYAITEAAYKALIALLVDICQRNPKIGRLRWQGNKNLVGQVDKQNMAVHRWFAAKACPGDYLYNLHGQIAADVNAQLDKLAGTTPTEKPIQAPTKIEKGSILEFVGTKQYSTSIAAYGVSAKPCRVKITSIAEGAKHPYHARSINANGSYVSGVYGWVDGADLKAIEQTPVQNTTTTLSTVQRGDSGTDVKTLQTKLKNLGYTLGTPDGIFGPNTEKATIAFQRDNDLDADGICGPKTWTKLNGAKYYTGQVTASALNVRSGAGTNYSIKNTIPNSTKVVIVAEKSGWGRLINSAGWVSLSYIKKI